MLQRRCLLAAGLGAGLIGGGRAAQAVSAPEFAGLDGWLNSDMPLSIAGLRGKVVLVDFWTWSCINCRRTIPYLNRWQSEYGPQGLQVVGIHTPEFRFEHARRDLEADIRALGIRYPVAQDNGFQTWKAWGNRAWPGFYVLDRSGAVVLKREGEGYAGEMEGVIRGLLGLAGGRADRHRGDDPDLSRIGSPEFYFGALHPTPQERAQSPRQGEVAYAFATAPSPALNRYALDGTWLREMEPLVLKSGTGGLRMHVSASKVHLVASAPSPVTVTGTVDGVALPPVEIGRPTLYTVFDGERFGEHRLDLAFGGPGVSIFSATFG